MEIRHHEMTAFHSSSQTQQMMIQGPFHYSCHTNFELPSRRRSQCLKITKKCLIYTGMSHYQGYVTHSLVCHTFRDISHSQVYVTLSRICHTFRDMSHFLEYVTLTERSLVRVRHFEWHGVIFKHCARRSAAQHLQKFY